MKASVGFSFLFLFSFFITTPAFTDNVKLADLEIYNRCYMKMFKSIVPRTAGLALTLQQKVAAKTLSGPNACYALLTQSEFNDNGVVRGPASTSLAKLSAAENKRLISTFHNFHNSWFSQRAMTFVSNDQTNFLLKDADEPSLYLTRALFGKAVPLSSFFTASESLQGIRENPDPATNHWQSKPFRALNEADYMAQYPDQLVISYGLANTIAALHSMPVQDSKLISYGPLVGVKSAEPLILPEVLMTTARSGNSVTDADLSAAIGAKRKNLNILEHLGGGVLGSQIFILKNTNLTLNQVAGSNNEPDQVIARRLASRVFEDLLCHQMPTLLPTDSIVKNRVDTNSQFGFRQSTSCMTCHSSLDPMAYTFRGYASYRTSPNANVSVNAVPSKEVIQGYGSPLIGIAKLPPNTNSTLFTLKNPTGELNYRDHEGILVTQPVTSNIDLGQKLAQSNDFYRCVAKRYYEFFTGFRVNLTKANIIPESDTATAKYHRAQVYSLGAKLKSTQNLNLLIKDILASNAFIYRNYHIESTGP